MKNKTLGITFLVVLFAAVISSIYYWQVTHQNTILTVSPHKGNVTLKEYKNDTYGFAVNYDNRYALDTSGTQSNYFRETPSIASISIPNSVFPNTNLNSAQMTFAVKDTTSSNCQNYVVSADSVKKMTKTVTIPAGKFYNVQVKGAAAGTMYTTLIYRIYENNLCYEVNQTVGISNIQNYDPNSNIKEVVVADVWNELSRIFINYKFTDAAKATDSTSLHGFLEGHIDIGPNCPVEQVEKPCPPSQEAYEAVQVIVYTEDKSQVLERVNVNSSGDYSVALPAGTYYATYTSVYNFYQPAMKKVTISSDKSTTQDFSIDTGIR